MLSGLDSDNKVKISLVVVIGVLVCLCFGLDVEGFLSSASLCCSTSSRKRGEGSRKGNISRMDPK